MLEEHLKQKISFTKSIINDEKDVKFNDILKYRIELYQYIIDLKINRNINAVRPTWLKVEETVEPVMEPVNEPVIEPVITSYAIAEPVITSYAVAEPVIELIDGTSREEPTDTMGGGDQDEDENTDILTDVNDDDLKEQAEEEEKIREQLAQLELEKLLKKKPRARKTK